MRKYFDLTNKKFGKLTAIKLCDDKKDNNKTTKLWKCVCECGNIIYKSARTLNEAKKLDKQLSCGCSRCNHSLIGQKIGDLVIKKYVYSKNGQKFWQCECVCGDIFVLSTRHLKQSKCLCLNKQKEKTKYIKRIRSIYHRMKERCYNFNDADYRNYGARGIKICNEWLNDIESFISWSLNNGYSPKLQIDRIDNNGNYEPTNCRWADMFTQANNKRNNINITYNGKTQCLKRWCRELNLPYRKTHKRIVSYKWDIDKCFAKKERVGF